MFDKFWYQTREEKFLDLNYDGLYVDQIGMVAFGVIQSRLIDHENKMKKPVKAEEADKDAAEQINKEIDQHEKRTKAAKTLTPSVQSARQPTLKDMKAGDANGKHKSLLRSGTVDIMSTSQTKPGAAKDTAHKQKDNDRVSSGSRADGKVDSMMSFNPGNSQQSEKDKKQVGSHI